MIGKSESGNPVGQDRVRDRAAQSGTRERRFAHDPRRSGSAATRAAPPREPVRWAVVDCTANRRASAGPCFESLSPRSSARVGTEAPGGPQTESPENSPPPTVRVPPLVVGSLAASRRADASSRTSLCGSGFGGSVSGRPGAATRPPFRASLSYRASPAQRRRHAPAATASTRASATPRACRS